MNADDARKISASGPTKYDTLCAAWMTAIEATIRVEARNGGHSITVPVYPVPHVMKMAMDALQKQGFRIEKKNPNVQISWSK